MAKFGFIWTKQTNLINTMINDVSSGAFNRGPIIITKLKSVITNMTCGILVRLISWTFEVPGGQFITRPS